MLQVVFGQDGDDIKDRSTLFSLHQSDIRYSKKLKCTLFDFVGFIIEKEKMLAVFPKHYFDDNSEIMNTPTKQQINENVSLLFKVINKYVYETNCISSSDKYIGFEENFESDYPFESFFKIYDYYRKFGIYREEKISLSKGYNGNISWKDTIQKSNTLVSNQNLIFLPLYSRKKSSKDVFISQCMVYVINYTIRMFPLFIQLPPIINKNDKIDFLTNRQYTLRQLYQYRNTIFKDVEKELINSLISFFEQYNENAKGGKIHFKINYFSKIWEKMVNKYLNDCFVEVDEENSKLIFNLRNQKRDKRFDSKKFDIDESSYRHSIIPDHYATDNDYQYIFDSKYYDNISDMNYKQFSYNIILGNSQLGGNKKLYSALLLPGNDNSKLHLKLSKPYSTNNPYCNYIIEQFLDVKLLMKNYITI